MEILPLKATLYLMKPVYFAKPSFNLLASKPVSPDLAVSVLLRFFVVVKVWWIWERGGGVAYYP